MARLLKERGAPPGLLHLLDEVGRLPQTSDADFSARIHDAHAGHPCFPRPPPSILSIQAIHNPIPNQIPLHLATQPPFSGRRLDGFFF